jgi:MFS family permease
VNGRRILLARVLRSFGYGFLSVVLAIYLALLGLNSLQIGLLLTTALLGSMLLTLLFSFIADRWGRRRVLIICATLMAASGLAFALVDNLWLLLAASLTGTISATSGEVGPFLALEQAILPQTLIKPEARTRLFALYNLLGSFAGAVGALFSGLVAALTSFFFPTQPLLADRLLLILYGLLAVVNLLIFLRLSEAVELVVEPAATATNLSRQRLSSRSRGVIFKLSALFSLDAFAGGLVVQSVVAYWFSLKFGLGLETLGPIFFGANTLSALSFLVAERVAAHIGLINTMVFTHLPSNVLLMLVPFMPDVTLAVALLLLRQALSQMDVPTRQSYTMAVVEPQERVAAAGFTSVARSGAQAISPVISGYALGVVALGLPFILAGGLKIGYDLALWFTFHHLKPAEELNNKAEPRLPENNPPLTQASLEFKETKQERVVDSTDL